MFLRFHKVKHSSNKKAIRHKGLLQLQCLFLQQNGVFPTEIIIILQFVKPLLEIQNLSVAFNNKIVVNALSYALFPGKITAVVGESGSGKSTIADLLPRFYDVTTGTIAIDGIDLKAYKLED